GVRAFTEDDLFESIRRLPSAVLRGAAEGALQAIVRADFWEVEEKGLVSFPTGRMAAYRESRERDAVIRGLPAAEPGTKEVRRERSVSTVIAPQDTARGDNPPARGKPVRAIRRRGWG